MDESSCFETVDSKSKANFGAQALKSINLNILLFENGKLRTSEKPQNYIEAHSAPIFFVVTVTDKLEFTNHW